MLVSVEHLALEPGRCTGGLVTQPAARIGEVAAELEINHTTAAHLCRPPAPVWPTLSPELIARLPEHLQRQIKAQQERTK